MRKKAGVINLIADEINAITKLMLIKGLVTFEGITILKRHTLNSGTPAFI